MARQFKKYLLSALCSGLFVFGILTLTQGCGKNFANECIGDFCGAYLPSWDSPTQDHDPVEGYPPEGEVNGSSGSGTSGDSGGSSSGASGSSSGGSSSGAAGGSSGSSGGDFAKPVPPRISYSGEFQTNGPMLLEPGG